MVAVETAVPAVPAVEVVPQEHLLLRLLQKKNVDPLKKNKSIVKKTPIGNLKTVFQRTKKQVSQSGAKALVTHVVLEQEVETVETVVPAAQVVLEPRVVTLATLVMPVAVGTMAPLAVTLTCPVVAGVLQY
jgi:hypothetical protein